jgi:probable rRNA maturation factor
MAANRVLLTVSHPAGAPLATFLRRTALTHLKTLKLAGCELSIALVTDRQIRALNRAWRAKDKATDVLSFGLSLQPDATHGVRLLGDVVVSLDTARRQAPLNAQTLKQELARYLAHGLLHLLGHDHHRIEPRRKMATLEEKLLGKPGLIPSVRGMARSRAGSVRAGSRSGAGRRPRSRVGTRRRVTR